MGGEHQAVCPHLQGAQRSGLGRQVQHHWGEAALRQRRQDHQCVFHSHLDLTHFSISCKLNFSSSTIQLTISLPGHKLLRCLPLPFKSTLSYSLNLELNSRSSKYFILLWDQNILPIREWVSWNTWEIHNQYWKYFLIVSMMRKAIFQSSGDLNKWVIRSRHLNMLCIIAYASFGYSWLINI